MRASSRAGQALTTGGLLLACVACAEPAHELAWTVSFEDAALRESVTLVEVQIRKDGCEGVTLFSSRTSGSSDTAAPGTLTRGSYGFFARALDAQCQWFAEGCVSMQLPSREDVRLVLSAVAETELDPSCLTQTSSQPITGVDASPPDRGEPAPSTPQGDLDGGLAAEDASVPARPPAPDASVPGSAPEPDASSPEPGPDASADPGDEDAATPGGENDGQCASIDAAVVACYDFDGDLRDATSLKNDAASANAPQFEAASTGQSLRVAGQRVSVEDDASLNLSTFTIELWIRPDGLINLDGNRDQSSLLVDKDNQYTVGFDSSGVLFLDVYRNRNSPKKTSASDNRLVPGSWYYVAVSYDGDTARIYLDGARVAEERTNVKPFAGNGAAMHIGTGSPESQRPYNGLIDALRISNRARSDEQICQHAGRRFAGGRCE